MFGTTIDYYLLKPLAHSRNLATEVELNERAKQSSYTLEEARAYLDCIQTEYFEHRFLIDPDMSYLDIGCGMGRLSVALSCAGATDVTGIDIVERHIEEARKLSSQIRTVHRPKFYCTDIHTWKSERPYDVIIALGAMEHINDPAGFLRLLPSLLKPTGHAFVSFEPFQSPFGDHMGGFFDLQIPWRGLIFSEKALLRLRSEYFRPTDPAKRYQDVVGGLNLMTFSQYLKWTHEAGLEFVFHNFNPQLKHSSYYRPLYPVSWILTRIPKIQDYFGVNIYSILERRG